MNSKLQPGGYPWAPFKGFSLLWDPPGDTPGGLLNLTHRADSFFGILSAWVATLSDEFLYDFGLHLLPASSYHVTYWDGINQDNVDRLSSSQRSDAVRALAGIPDLADDWAPVREVLGAEVPGSCVLQFSGLEVWSGVSLVALLRPVDEEAFQAIRACRRAWNVHFGKRYGCWSSEVYAPHITLGYYERPEGAGADPRWAKRLAGQLADTPLALKAPSLYAFSDMASYFRFPAP